MPFLRLFSRVHLPQVLRQFEQDVETVINVLQPGPLGIVEHKFTAAEVQKAKATVQRAVDNWRRNSSLEKLCDIQSVQHLTTNESNYPGVA